MPREKLIWTFERLGQTGRDVLFSITKDREGTTLFLAVCLVFGGLWQVGFLLNDTWTVANTLVGVSEGHLYIDRLVYGTNFVGSKGIGPGTHVVGSRLYGRNYGQVFFALPFFWALKALVTVADPRILLAAIWSLGLVLLGHQVGRLIDRYRPSVIVACGLALATFAINVRLATPLSSRWLHHLGLQLSTIVAAGLLAVVLYHLLKLVVGRRSALVLVAVSSVSTPIAFWSTLPKRHTLSALLVMLVVYSFARSRLADSDTERALHFRALAYVWVGLLAWVHGAEGLVTLLALGSVDLLTARSNTPRELATIGAVFGISLIPFFATNALVTGNPMFPPRLWPSFTGTEQVILNGEPIVNGEAIGSTPSGADGSGANADVTPESGEIRDTNVGKTIGTSLTSAALTVVEVSGQLRSELSSSLSVVGQPNRMFRTFVRSGWGVEQARDRQAINLTVMESAPIVGAAVVLPAFARWGSLRAPRSWSTVRQIDLLVVVAAGLFALIYLYRLPLKAEITVRYLHPIYPLMVYALVRVPPIRSILENRLRTVGWSYAAGVLIGGQLILLAVWLLTSTIGGAIQLHGLINLAFAGLLSVWTLGALGVDDESYYEIGAVILGLALAAGTVAMLFMTWNHLAYGDPVLGIGRMIRVVIPP